MITTRSGKARAVLLPVDEDTDLETLLRSSNNRFSALLDRAAESRQWTPLDNTP